MTRAIYAQIFLFIISLSLVVFTIPKIKLYKQVLAAQIQQDQLQEVLYLPNGKGLDLISFGYKNTLSNYLWFNTISYFGKHYATDQNYSWLNHMCGLVTDLNPLANYVYQFCSQMLSWEAGKAEEGVALLSKAIKYSGDDWRLFYYRGFIYLHFLKNTELARDDFVKASKLPEADAFVARLASKTMQQLNDPVTAIEFLEESIRNANDNNERSALLQRKRKLQAELVRKQAQGLMMEQKQ